MKIVALMICAIALAGNAVRGQESAGEKAADAWDTTKHTAKQVGRTLKKETKKAANTVVEAVTPDPDAHRVNVKLSATTIDMPREVPAGKAAFVVTNNGNEKVNFDVEGQGFDKNFQLTLSPQQTRVFHVTLRRGHYQAFCVPKDRNAQRLDVKLTVR